MRVAPLDILVALRRRAQAGQLAVSSSDVVNATVGRSATVRRHLGAHCAQVASASSIFSKPIIGSSMLAYTEKALLRCSVMGKRRRRSGALNDAGSSPAPHQSTPSTKV